MSHSWELVKPFEGGWYGSEIPALKFLFYLPYFLVIIMYIQDNELIFTD